jgi:hypothetical protein
MAALTAEQLIAFIANTPWEFSNENIYYEYSDFKLGCSDWLEKNCVELSANPFFNDDF